MLTTYHTRKKKETERKRKKTEKAKCPTNPTEVGIKNLQTPNFG